MQQDSPYTLRYSKEMTKETYIQEFGYIIFDSDEIILRVKMEVLFFMEVIFRVDELPGYMWN